MSLSRFFQLFLLFCLSATIVWAEDIEFIEPLALDAWLDQKDSPLILDVRGRSAYLDGSLPGALDAGTDPMGFLPDSRGGDVVIISAPGQPLQAWYTRLVDYGHRVQVLRGGIDNWRAAELPVERAENSYTKPGTVPFVIPRGLCELNEPAEIFD